VKWQAFSGMIQNQRGVLLFGCSNEMQYGLTEQEGMLIN
jgi:hypothetical protein